MDSFDNPMIIPGSQHSSTMSSGSDAACWSRWPSVAPFLWDGLAVVLYISQRKSFSSMSSSSAFATDGLVSLGETAAMNRGNVVLSLSSSY